MPARKRQLIGGATPDEGELILKNPGILLAYHNLPGETAKRIRDGWYHTGDICRRDADGFYYFVGRTDDMFVSGGENIFPIEVESLLERHPAVQQAVVLPFEHELKGQVPYAFRRAARRLIRDRRRNQSFCARQWPGVPPSAPRVFSRPHAARRHQQDRPATHCAVWPRCTSATPITGASHG